MHMLVNWKLLTTPIVATVDWSHPPGSHLNYTLENPWKSFNDWITSCDITCAFISANPEWCVYTSPVYVLPVPNTGWDTEFRTFCLVCLGSGVWLRLRFIKCGWYVSQKWSSLPVLCSKIRTETRWTKGLEFGVTPSANAYFSFLGNC